MASQDKCQPYRITLKDVLGEGYKGKELEETRRCLLNMYHSSIQTHAGYLIAIIIGSLTLFSRWQDFFNCIAPWYSEWVFLVLLYLLIVIGFWTIMRISYWNSYSNYALGIIPKTVVKKFNEYNKYKYEETGECYFEKPPRTTMLQWAINEEHFSKIDKKYSNRDSNSDNNKKEHKIGLLNRLSIITANSSGIKLIALIALGPCAIFYSCLNMLMGSKKT